jgi:hypothetical protein
MYQDNNGYNMVDVKPENSVECCYLDLKQQLLNSLLNVMLVDSTGHRVVFAAAQCTLCLLNPAFDSQRSLEQIHGQVGGEN